MSMWKYETTIVEKAQSLLLQVAVRKQLLEPLRGSKVFGRWVRDWIKTYDMIITDCVKVIRQHRAECWAMKRCK